MKAIIGKRNRGRRRVKLTSLHFLQGLALSLLDENPDKHQESPVEDGKHKECSPAQVLNCMRCRLGEDKVEQPLCRRADSDTRLSDPGGKDLAHIYLEREGSVSP